MNLEQKQNKSIKRISSAIWKHGAGVVQFSGGKDSLAVLHMLQPVADKVTVIFGDPGDTYPHVFELVHEICDEWGFTLQVVRPDVQVLDYVQAKGLPVDVLPIWASAQGAQFVSEDRKPKVLMQSGLECCAAMLWEPIHRYVQASGTRLVFRGSKGTDKHVTAPDGCIFDGVEYVSPLWEWTDDDVFAYLHNEGVTLPLQYQHGCNHSLDCMECTAWGDTRAERQRVRFTKEFYPIEFKRWQNKMLAVKHETIRQLEAIEPFINIAEG